MIQVDQTARFTEWLAPRGYFPIFCEIKSWRPPAGALVILGGRSPRDLLSPEEKRAQGIHLPSNEPLLHSVVGRSDGEDRFEVAHDPHPSRAGVLDQRDFILLVPFEPSRKEIDKP